MKLGSEWRGATMDKVFLIERIIKDYPRFTDSKIEINENGWSNLVVVVDNTYIFRFPRSQRSMLDLEIERAVLSRLRPEVVNVVDVPYFEFNSKDTTLANYVGYRMIDGSELEAKELKNLDDKKITQQAEIIGAFLSVLHSIDDIELMNHIYSVKSFEVKWKSLYELFLMKASIHFNDFEIEKISQMFEEYLDQLNNLEKACLIHGDLTHDHILYSNKLDRINGIIDFGDLIIGDPALDFAGLYHSYGKEFIEKVLQFYDLEIDDDFMNRIENFYMNQIPLNDYLYGIEIEDHLLVQESIRNIKEFIYR